MMQNLTATLGRLTVVLAGALALGSCSRAEYAFLPKSASYLGTTTAAPKARATAATPAAQATVPAAQAPVVATPVAAEKPVAATPAPTATPLAAKPQAPVAAQVEAAAATPAPQKLSLFQRLAVTKITKKINKLAAKSPQFKQGDNTASTSRIDGNLRTGIILLLIGLLVGFLNGTIGTIIAIIGLIFIILWLLDSI